MPFVQVILAYLEAERLQELQIADPRGTDTHEHLHELRAADEQERYIRLARDRFGEQGLAGAGRTDDQDALGNVAAQARIAIRLAQEFDDFHKLSFRFVNPLDVGELDADVLLHEHLCIALADTDHIARAAATDPAEHEQPDHRKDRGGSDQRKQRSEPVSTDSAGIVHVCALELLDELVVFDPRRAKADGLPDTPLRDG